ncbi:MAG: alkaline phosphatase family protein [Bacteroidetes bacterium]|nr:alkaline phosphatase family protein [Bacteroidota bacterium]
MKKLFIFLLFTFHFSLFTYSQPKLVVGIVVDQMRYDYLEKYWNKFGNDGFKKLVNEGFNCKNTNYNYVPTFTGPGHASIFTGATPSVHGIVSNQWFNRETRKPVYCVYDMYVSGAGASSESAKMSPQNLLAPTVGEELKKENSTSKVIGIALKDRAAILPAGHNPTAAYWYEDGNFISSTYYMKELPKWVSDFNKKELARNYLSQSWSTILPIEKYTESDADDCDCEQPFKGKEKTIFPYDLQVLMKDNGGMALIRSTPFGNSLTKDFAIETIYDENLGKGKETDFLSVSFSSTDYIGHQFGPQSVELEDCYIRLDKDLAELLKFIDESVGKNNVLVFLTADHGAGESVPCLKKKNIPSGVIDEKTVADSVKKFLFRVYNDSLLTGVSDFDIYLDREKINKKNLSVSNVAYKTAQYLSKMDGIADALTASTLEQENNFFTDGSRKDSIRVKVRAGFYSDRCGDVIFVLKPNWLEGYHKGTSHGTPYIYDTHVPLLWWGYDVKPGNSSEPIIITQIAPTVSKFLKISSPAGCQAKPIQSLTK